MATKLRRADGTQMLEDGYLVLEDGSKLPGAGTTFEQTLITMHAERHQPIAAQWWDSLIAKLAARPANASDARVLANLNHCFIDGYCGKDITPLTRAYDAALSHGRVRPQVLSAHAEFAWYLLHDEALAERQIREATSRVPYDPNARRNLAVLLIATGKLEEARTELERIERINYFGMFDPVINPLKAALARRASPQGVLPRE
jgi:hypothetical protein